MPGTLPSLCSVPTPTSLSAEIGLCDPRPEAAGVRAEQARESCSFPQRQPRWAPGSAGSVASTSLGAVSLRGVWSSPAQAHTLAVALHTRSLSQTVHPDRMCA